MNKHDELLGIMLPDHEELFLLPNVSIAEILTLSSNNQLLPAFADLPGYMGNVVWRGLEVALLHLNAILNPNQKVDRLEELTMARIAVINPILTPGFPTYGILTTGTPKLTRLKPGKLKTLDANPDMNLISMIAHTGEERVCIPDVARLEHNMHKVLLAQHNLCVSE